MRRVKKSGEIALKYQTVRLEVCKSCTERVIDQSTGEVTEELLVRELRGKLYCGAPWNKKLSRSPFHEGCGCNLREKLLYEAAECPRGRWGPGKKFGNGVYTIYDNRNEKGTIKDAIDVHVMSKDHKPDLSGIGDTLAFLPIVRGMRRKHRDKRIRYVIMSANEQWAKLGYDDICFEDDGERTPAEIEIYGSDTHLSALDIECIENEWTRHKYWEDRLDVKAERFRIEPDKKFLLEAKQKFAKATIEGRPIVAISPFASYNIQRTWPMRHWLVLLEKLKQEGSFVYLIDGPQEDRSSLFDCPKLLGELPMRVASRLALTGIHIGNDSGMNHLCGLLGTDAITITGPTWGEQVFGWYGNVKTIQGFGECSACYWRPEKGWSVPCQSACLVMWDIRPETVFEAIMKTIEEKKEVAV